MKTLISIFALTLLIGCDLESEPVVGTATVTNPCAIMLNDDVRYTIDDVNPNSGNSYAKALNLILIDSSMSEELSSVSFYESGKPELQTCFFVAEVIDGEYPNYTIEFYENGEAIDLNNALSCDFDMEGTYDFSWSCPMISFDEDGINQVYSRDFFHSPM